MSGRQENERNDDTYPRLKEMTRQTYPRGWFMGVAEDQIVATAAEFRDLEARGRA